MDLAVICGGISANYNSAVMTITPVRMQPLSNATCVLILAFLDAPP